MKRNIILILLLGILVCSSFAIDMGPISSPSITTTNLTVTGIISNATYSSFTVSSEIPIVNTTGTVTIAMGDTCYLNLTTNTTLQFADEFPTNGVSRVRIDIKANAFSLTLPTNGVGTIFNWTTEPTFSTSSYTRTLFTKDYMSTTWEVKQ